jgi:hypothetical protein
MTYDILAFQKWVYNSNCFKSIEKDFTNELLPYILSSNTLQSSRNKIIELLENSFTKYYNQTPQNTFQQWTEQINQYCFQGGYGYAINYTNAPHHWCIKPEFYTTVLELLNEKIIISSILCNAYLEIANKPAMEKWSG